MIRVQVKLYGVLHQHHPKSLAAEKHRGFPRTLPASATAGDLLDALCIDRTLVGGLAVNDQRANENRLLAAGDNVRFFPRSAGGQGKHVFIAGVMQGSRPDHLIDAQDYRHRISATLEARYPGIRISDPFALHPESVNYEQDKVRETFESMTSLAGQADVLIAYLPTASMGTAIEMWTAYNANKYIIAVTELKHNWVVKVTADQIVPDLDTLLELLESGQLADILNS